MGNDLSQTVQDNFEKIKSEKVILDTAKGANENKNSIGLKRNKLLESIKHYNTLISSARTNGKISDEIVDTITNKYSDSELKNTGIQLDKNLQLKMETTGGKRNKKSKRIAKRLVKSRKNKK